MEKNITVREFDKISVTTLKNSLDERLAKTTFKQLKSFILPASEASDNVNPFNEYGELKDASVCMTIGVENKEEVIRVKNYVGTISLPCGVNVEVLPKIAGDGAGSIDKEQARKLVIEMLKACSDIVYKSFKNADLSVENLNLFELYIRLFLSEVKRLQKKGLRAGYVPYEDNENFLKGKLLFNEHIKRNYAHKEKFYVNYDLFSFNRAENRLMKAALKYLLKKSNNDSNKREIRQYLLLFDEITASENIEIDFAKCETGRAVKDYEQVLKLCRVFLRKKSFTMYSGASDVVALMFPMETLFERYIAKEMQKSIGRGWKLYPQSEGKTEYLFDENRFLLRPDVLLENGNKKIIIDTKWKKLNPHDKNNSISQADMYQMYAYHTRFPEVQEVVLLYPFYEEVKELKEIVYSIVDMGVKIHIAFFDLGKYQKGTAFGECIVGMGQNTNLRSII